MNIPFHEIGVNTKAGAKIVEEIRAQVAKKPSDPIVLRAISERTDLPGDDVKETLFALLNLRYLKSTFLPRHKKCGVAIGGQEKSVITIEQKAEEGDYPRICTRCNEEIGGMSHIQIEIMFWKNDNDKF